MASPSPVFRSMTDPIIFMKVPFKYFIVVMFLLVVGMVFTGMPFLSASIGISAYVYGIRMTAKDPRWVEVVYVRIQSSDLDFSEKRKYVA